ncbi:MAG: acetamidase, partial [Calditrichaeota bacterium]
MNRSPSAVLFSLGLLIFAFGCQKVQQQGADNIPAPQYSLTADQTHNKFSRAIAPVLKVPSGAVVEVQTKEATDGQLNVNSTSADVPNVKFDPIHPLTGPVYVEGAEPGDILAVKLLKIEVGDWGWAGIFPGFGFLADEFKDPYLKTVALGKDAKVAHFSDKINIP